MTDPYTYDDKIYVPLEDAFKQAISILKDSPCLLQLNEQCEDFLPEIAGSEQETTVAADVAVDTPKPEEKEQPPNAEASGATAFWRDFFEKQDATERRVEGLMRDAIADGHLHLLVKMQDGQYERLVYCEEWRSRAFGLPGIENVAHHLTNPGVDTDGRPVLLKISNFQDWLTTYGASEPHCKGPTRDAPETFPTVTERKPNENSLQAATRRRGAPMQYDWPDAKAFAFRLLEERGEFREWDTEWKTQADLEREVSSYMGKNGQGNGPVESTVRERVSPWLAEWRLTKGSGA